MDIQQTGDGVKRPLLREILCTAAILAVLPLHDRARAEITITGTPGQPRVVINSDLIYSYLDTAVLSPIEGVWNEQMEIVIGVGRPNPRIEDASSRLAILRAPTRAFGERYLVYGRTPSGKQFLINNNLELLATADPSVYVSENGQVEFHVEGNRLRSETSFTVQGVRTRIRRDAVRLYPQKVESGSAMGATQGTGFVVGEGGLIATNNHVIDGRDSVFVHDLKLGRWLEATVLSQDPTNDLAVLRVVDARNLPCLALRMEPVRQGEEVISIGFPLAQAMGSSQPKVTTGVISSEYGYRDDPRFLQTTSTIIAGNSGGPLLDQTGRVVGVTSSKLVGEGIEGVNYALKTPYLYALILSQGRTCSATALDDHATVPAVVDRVAESILQVLAK